MDGFHPQFYGFDFRWKMDGHICRPWSTGNNGFCPWSPTWCVAFERLLYSDGPFLPTSEYNPPIAGIPFQKGCLKKVPAPAGMDQNLNSGIPVRKVKFSIPEQQGGYHKLRSTHDYQNRSSQLKKNKHLPDPSKKTSQISAQHKVCGFCRQNGEIFFDHLLKDEDGKVVCPVLKAYICPHCGATGKEAHTVSYCPLANKPKSLAIALKQTSRDSCGRFRNRK